MTNEEKAKEIVFGWADTIQEDAYDAAIKMAEWKDHQFKEYLEKNRTNYPDFMHGTDAYAFGMKEGYVKAFDRIINELFNEE